ncbi:MAG: TRAP transporter substrate-binding protein DctP, partial [Deinococcota bacterium]|nr:TRAP transporter substrate-binding protein DctP [Deinococcota bacterium]
SRRPIRSPEDMRGLKFRVAGTRLFLEIFAQLGTSAITMNFGEVFTSLQQGVIDGQENPLNIIESARLFEVQSHVTLWNYVFDPIFLTFNGQVWASLTPEEQEIITEAGLEAMDYQREVIFEDMERLPEKLAEQGMEVYRPTPEELEVFRSAVEPVYSHPDIVERIGTDNIEMILARVAAVREELGR